MPIYEYKCSNCGHTFEILQSIKDEQLKRCLKCGKDTLQKMVSNIAGLIFKGSGYYLTDYKNKSSKPEKSKVNGNVTKNKEENKKSEPQKVKEGENNKTETKGKKS